MQNLLRCLYQVRCSFSSVVASQISLLTCSFWSGRCFCSSQPEPTVVDKSQPHAGLMATLGAVAVGVFVGDSGEAAEFHFDGYPHGGLMRGADEVLEWLAAEVGQFVGVGEGIG